MIKSAPNDYVALLVKREAQQLSKIFASDTLGCIIKSAF
jgi:hypothetical protein